MFAVKSRLAFPVWVLILLIVLPAAGANASGPKPVRKADLDRGARTLVWSDEFNGASGSLPDPSKWKIVSSGSGFGNQELEYYTGRPTNIRQQNGHLIITARKENYTGHDGMLRNYTSARIESEGLFELKYGRIEARIKLPKGRGVWPAFWMLGSDYNAIGWPACGEVDIMENVGSEPSRIHGSLHGPGYSGGNPLSGVFNLRNRERFSDDYHVFAVEWEPQTMRFYVDNTLYETQNAGNLPPGKTWAFDHPFFLVLNVAVGGYWPGSPDAKTQFPTSMLVDYVRVYQLGDQH